MEKDSKSNSPDRIDSPNLYIAQTSYHLMVSCSRCKTGDYLIYTGSYQEDRMLKKMVEDSFARENRKEIFDLNHFKSNISDLFKFKTIMRRSLKEYLKIRFITIYVFNDVDPIVQWIMHYVWHDNTVLIEEGIGLYRDIKIRREIFLKLLGKYFFSRWYENIDRIGSTSSIDIIECTNPFYLNEKQKKKEIRNFVPLQLGRIARSAGIHQYKSKYWFIGQPIVEDGVVDNNQYIDWLNVLLSRYQDGKAEWVIKPHPRENVQKYEMCRQNVRVINEHEIPIELLINTENEIKIYSFYSSALLSLAKMKNIQCYAVCRVKNRELVEKGIIDIFKENGINIISI